MAAIPHDLGVFTDSRYAAERRRIDRYRPFSRELEAEFLSAKLVNERALIRAAACMGLIVVTARAATEVADLLHPWLLVQFSLAVVASLVLLRLTWSSGFERQYVAWAQIVIPLRNALGAAHFAAAVALGRLELLMIVPMMVVGPFFFSGLRLQIGAAAGALTFLAFAVSSALLMPHALALRCDAILTLFLGGSVIVALHFERGARARFLERYLIAALAQHDPLTGARNRRSFDDHLARVWTQAAENRGALAIILIDVDHFKAYNDRYGHLAGDDALRRVAGAVQEFTRRSSDVFARYGGEEFAAILPGVEGGQAMRIAESMRRAVLELGIEHRGSPTHGTVTISLGVAAIEPGLARDFRGAVQLADEALYQAKVNGRNRTEFRDDVEYRLLETGVFRAGTAHTMPRRGAA